MNRVLVSLGFSLVLNLFLFTAATAADKAEQADAEPLAVATFHCLGLYWSPPGGAPDREVLVSYRKEGASKWNTGFPMRYNPIPDTDNDLSDYRGSIVHLKPDTTYEVRLTLAGTATKATLTASTWSEQFPVGETVSISERNEPLAITESGTPEGYRVYDGQGATIDVRHQHDNCITVDASYVILRNLTVKGAGDAQGKGSRPSHAILIEGGHDIIIEHCDVSDWGRLNPERGFGYNMESAIASRCPTLKRLVIQRCKLHHPTFDGSNWYEPKYPTHSRGPQCISLFNAGGNHVIRYNECYSDMEHMFNDIIGGASNGSYEGAPGPDSDIYGNYVSHCWDDGLEVEGGSRNVRVWDNYITQSMMMIGNAACSIGPLYIWRNVATRAQWRPEDKGGYFLKMGFAGGEKWMTGHMYILHNTLFKAGEYLPTGALGGSRIVKHTVSRNNIFQVRSPTNHCASNNEHNIDNDFDYDLINGKVPPDQEPHAVRGVPIYVKGAGLDPDTLSGRFQLTPDSPGANAGAAIPNFSADHLGDAPDMGAHQRGQPPIQYGVKANQR
ncbi:MAG: hypothetical protein ACODAD_01835 [Planctomycetota bacterium]